MKKLYIALVLSVLAGFCQTALAQINYAFSAASGTYTANSSPTQIIGASQDFAISAATNIGFSFVMGGNTYTQFKATSDGYLTLDMTASFTNGWNNLATGSNLPIIAPLWDDEQTSSTGEVNYKLTGTSPNRVLTVEWKNMLWDWSAGNPSISYQVKLYETTNVIEFQYLRLGNANQAGSNVSSGASASIGLSGACTGNFYSLNGVGTSPTASTTTETTTLNTKPPQGQIYRWTPVTSSATNDLCANAINLTYNIGTCTTTAGTVIGATATGSPAAPACWSPATTSNDVWYTVTKPLGQTGMVVSLDNTSSTCNSFGTAFAVYSGGCSGLTLVGCADNGGSLNPNNATLTLSGLPNAATQYWIRVEGDGTTTGNFQICVREPLCPGALGTGVVNVSSLPYSITGATTCGMVDNLTSSNLTVCGSTLYTTAEDAVYIFTPTTSGQITINLTSASSYVGLMLYNGCPVTGGGGACVANSQSSLGTQSLCATVTAGTTYYLVIDQWASPTCIPSYSLTISSPSGAPAGTTCSNPVNITLPYSATGESTACMGNDYTNSSSGSCGSLYESGEDKVYALTVTGPQCIGVTLSNSSTWSIGFQVYSGCPGSAGTTCIGSFGGSNPLAGSVTLPAAGTYYIIVDTWASPTNASYDISIVSYGTGPANDLPCNATLLSLGTSVNGDNSCSSGTSDPVPTPPCWYAGTLNTVWYKVVCPASGQIKITTTLGGNTNTQIAVYSGTCSGLSLIACNDDATTCTGSTGYNSELSLTGLTPGNTYYIQVDGYANATGTFSIIAIDGSSTLPSTNQDCLGGISVCSTVINQSTSYFGCGNINDIPPIGTFGNPNVNPASTNSGCQFAGELNVVWYIITIGSNGNLAWTLTPTVSGFYDWSLYPLNGNTCSDIGNDLVAPVRCNWNCSSTGGTGMQTNANIPAGGSACNYEPVLAVTAGQQYALHLSNYSGTTGGFTLNFGNSTCGISSPSQIVWTGTSGTAWATAANWGGCTPPTCTLNALVVPTTNQPVISANASVKNLTISSGSTLTINAGVTLTICGDFINNGTLIVAPTSTILFNNGNVVHNMTGNFTGSSKIGNLVITKTGGSVILNNDLDIGGSFTTSNSTSVLNTNGKYIKIAGNFNNNAAGTTFTNVTGGTLEFNGTSAQTYTPGGSLTLNNVVMNHTGTGVTLSGNHMILGTAGTLTLTQGKIITGNLEVQVNNTAPAAVTTGNTTSFVQGYLRRKLQSTGSYDLPVGEATKGYQRANVTFTAATTIDNLLASFSVYASVPAALNTSECGTTYNMPALNNGKWTISAFNSSNTQITGNGTYNMTLYNLAGSYNNQTGANGWTVMKDPGTGWMLNGTCVSSPINSVQRTGMTGFSNFGTAQATTPLPIELLSFTGRSAGRKNLLDWVTASETNNDYFTLEHSLNGIDFEEVTRVEGAGTSTQINGYHATDNYPYSGVTYYRLKQTDFDGRTNYSGIIALENKMDNIKLENVHPNPTNGDISFDFVTPFKGAVMIEIVDAYGKLVMKKAVDVHEGRTEVNTEMSQLAAGIYSFRISFDEGNYSSITKVVKY